MESLNRESSFHITVDFFDTRRLAFVAVALADEVQGPITISVVVRLCLRQHHLLPFSDVLPRRLHFAAIHS